MSETTNLYLRLNLFVAIPCGVGLYMLAYPIVELLFLRGKFTADDALMTSQVVQIYALTLIPVSGVRILAPAYYAVKNTWYPGVAAGFGLLVHIMVAPWLMQFYGLRGLNFSGFISGSVNFLLLLGSFSSMVTFFNWKLLGMQIMKFIPPAAAMALSLTLYPIWRSMIGQGIVAQVLSLGLSIFLAAVVYFAIAAVLKLEESKATTSRIFGKIKRKFLS